MEIFKDNNNWNEKSIIGFIAFAIMCVIMIVDLVTGYVGKDLIINEFVYDSFVFVVLGCFGKRICKKIKDMAFKMKMKGFGNTDNKTVKKMKLERAKIKAKNKLKKSGKLTKEKEDEINSYTDY